MLSTVLNHKFWELVTNRQEATHIVFTDQPAPNDVKKYDVSEAQDGGVVMWVDEATNT
jgi:hypothetical protein